MFAFAVHVTDVRPALIRGARTIALALLAWLTPLMALIGAGFLLALPFTGLAPLWGTRSAVSILWGRPPPSSSSPTPPSRTERPRFPPCCASGRIAALLPAPLILIAAYGLALRVGQHGWTPDRVAAAACLLVGAAYAGGYAFAALRPGRWLAAMERTNVITAVLAVAVLLALFTPLVDPARLSVNSQVRRLHAGRIAPDSFDYAFLKPDPVAYGRRALDRLKADANPAIAKAAAAADRLQSRVDAPVTATTWPVASRSIRREDPAGQLPAAGLVRPGL